MTRQLMKRGDLIGRFRATNRDINALRPDDVNNVIPDSGIFQTKLAVTIDHVYALSNPRVVYSRGQLSILDACWKLPIYNNNGITIPHLSLLHLVTCPYDIDATLMSSANVVWVPSNPIEGTGSAYFDCINKPITDSDGLVCCFAFPTIRFNPESRVFVGDCTPYAEYILITAADGTVEYFHTIDLIAAFYGLVQFDVTGPDIISTNPSSINDPGYYVIPGTVRVADVKSDIVAVNAITEAPLADPALPQ